MESNSPVLEKVEIKDVLAALPQIFPGVQQVPLGCIRPNPKNPGPPISEDQIAEMAANLEVTELDNPIKLMPDPENPLAPGVSLNPKNPHLKGDGRPWEPADFNWVILAGELRYRAFGRLKREAIPAYICNPSPQDVPGKTHRDNAVRDRGWWADYQSIEQHIQVNPNDSQGQVAVKLKIARPRVNRAIALLPLLNSESRALISTDGTNSNKGIWGASELAAAELADLGPGTGLKPGVKGQGSEEAQKLWPYPPIPPETQELVHRTLLVAIDHKMTQAQVKGLVAWVKGGGQPEEFGKASLASGPSPGMASPSNPSNGSAQAATPQDPQEGPSFGSWLGGAVLAKQFTKKFGVLGPFLNRYLPHLPRLFNWTKG
ncbi:MAG TPA: hypothetical protein VJ873_11980, partial [bacterium]|nr:hypothetical protein [bacterium]